MAKIRKIFLSPPDVGLAEEQAMVRALRSGWVSPVGPEINAFEEEIASFVGATHAVATNSGTAALHLGLRALGVSESDSVITSTMTFVATANAIAYLGARPIFVDVLDDGSIDPQLVKLAIDAERASGKRVGAILPVDIYGRSAQYSDLVPIADEYGIPVLADSAESLGSHHAGKMAGAWGDLSALSFNGNKIITTSGGGMLVTSSADHAQYVRYLATQAREPVVHYEHVELGYNYRLSNISAAIGRAQLTRLPRMIEMRRARRLQYEEFFSHVSGVSMLYGNIEEDNCWLTLILVDEAATGWSPLELMDFLALQGIETRPMWKPMHLQPLYRDAKFIGGNVAETMFRSGLALPSGSSMSDYDLERVLGEISTFLGSRP